MEDMLSLRMLQVRMKRMARFIYRLGKIPIFMIKKANGSRIIMAKAI